MTKQFQRKIFIYKNYFRDFYNKQSKEVQKKIDWTIELAQELKIIPPKIFKLVEDTDGLYEIDVKVGIENFRIVCFFSEDAVIVLLNGFKKGLTKLRKNEIEKANKLRKEYYFEKGKDYKANVI